MWGSQCPGGAYQMHSLLITAWWLRGPQMSSTCGRCCEGCLQRSKPKREGRPWWRRIRRRTRGGGPLWPAWWRLCRCLSRWRAGLCGPGCSRAKVPGRRGGRFPPVRRPRERRPLWSCHPHRWMKRWRGISRRRRRKQSGCRGGRMLPPWWW